MAKKKMNDGLRDMLNNLDAGRENDLRSRIGELERMGYAAAGRMPEAATSQGVDDAGIVRTLSDEINLQEEVGTADGLQINWWLPLTLADDDVWYVRHLAFKTISGIKYLYIAGTFTRIGGIDVSNIARYSFATRQWENVNGGVNYYIHHFAWSPTDVLYIVGAFTGAGGDPLANGIAKDDGAGSWVNVNGGISGSLGIGAYVTWDAGGVLYIGGDFLNAGGVALADHIAKDNGAGAWTSVNGGLPAGSQCACIVWDAAGVLHIGGLFNNASGVALADHIAKDDGAGAWTSVNGGLVNNYVEKIVFDAENNMYICGNFTAAGLDPLTTYIAKAEAGTWVSLGGGLNARCRNMAFGINGILMACGDFENASEDADADRIAWFDGENWRAFSNGGGLEGINGYVWTLAMDTNGSLYAGGWYSTAGTIQCESLACFVRPLSDAIDMIAGLFEQYQARANTQPQWFKKIKAVDESVNNSAVMQSDDELAMTLKANGIYAVRGRVWFNTLAAADFKYRFYMPGGTLMYCKHTYYPAGSSTGTTAIETVIPTVSTSVLGALALAGYIEFDILVKVDASDRILTFQWAQDTATVGNTTVLAGSYIEAHPAG